MLARLLHPHSQPSLSLFPPCPLGAGQLPNLLTQNQTGFQTDMNRQLSFAVTFLFLISND